MVGPYKFGDWTFESASGELSSPGKSTRLQPKVAALLVFLLGNQHRLLSREELVDSVWGGRPVSDDAVNRSISILRQTLTPDDTQAYIETVPRRGYIARFPMVQGFETAMYEASKNTQAQQVTDNLSPKAETTRESSKGIMFTVGASIVVLAMISFRWNFLTEGLLPGSDEKFSSIAVMPFLDLTPRGENDWIASGVSDAILHELAEVEGLRVVARTSSFVVAERKLTVPEIAQALDVGLVLEGSVQQSGDVLRVIAQLIDGESGDHRWSITLDGNASDVFDLQENVAARVMSTLSEEWGLSLGSKQKRFRPSLEAYEQLSRGREQLERKTINSLAKAVRHFERAIELAPDYALARVYLAEAIAWQDQITLGLNDSYSGMPSSQARANMRPLLEEALLLDPESGEARALLAKITPNVTAAEAGFEIALAQSPNNADTHYWYADFLILRAGRYERALEVVDQGLTIDPLSPRLRSLHAKSLWSLGLKERANETMLEYVRENPEYPSNYKLMARWRMQAGRLDEALRWTLALRALDPASPSHWGEFGGECFYLNELGLSEALNRCNQEFQAAHPNSITARRDALMQRGDMAGAIELFREAVKEEPGNLYRVMQLGFFLIFAGDYEGVLTTLEKGFPGLFKNQPVTPLTIWAATTAATAACKTNVEPLCSDLLTNIMEASLRYRARYGGGYFTGMEMVEVAALRGNTEEAISKLEKLVEEDWCFACSTSLNMPSLSDLQGDPRFEALRSRVQDKLALQRERFEATKNDPLF